MNTEGYWTLLPIIKPSQNTVRSMHKAVNRFVLFGSVPCGSYQAKLRKGCIYFPTFFLSIDPHLLRFFLFVRSIQYFSFDFRLNAVCLLSFCFVANFPFLFLEFNQSLAWLNAIPRHRARTRVLTGSASCGNMRGPCRRAILATPMTARPKRRQVLSATGGRSTRGWVSVL